MKQKKDELAVIVKAKDLGSYIFTVTDKSPKKFRFTLITRMQNLILQVIEDLFRANAIYVRASNDNKTDGKKKRISKRSVYQFEIIRIFCFDGKRTTLYFAKTV